MRWLGPLAPLKRGLGVLAGIVRARVAGRQQPRAPNQPLDRSPAFMTEIPDFGPNPGNLRMLLRIPADGVQGGRPLIVLLHGCDQEAETFAQTTSWIAWADERVIPLLLVKQAKANNRLNCFHWFRPTDIQRDSGEAGSIAAMTRAAIARFGSDPDRVFIAGLSAGGAMTAAVLSAYPDLFAAGAVVAGLPVGTASTPLQAVARMAKAGLDVPPDRWAAQRKAGVQSVRWPRLSVWYGEADRTVDPANAGLLASQWRALHDLAAEPDTDSTIGSVRRRLWADAVELWSIPGLGHGYPVEAAADRVKYMLPSPVPATPAIAKFWGLD